MSRRAPRLGLDVGAGVVPRRTDGERPDRAARASRRGRAVALVGVACCGLVALLPQPDPQIADAVAGGCPPGLPPGCCSPRRWYPALEAAGTAKKSSARPEHLPGPRPNMPTHGNDRQPTHLIRDQEPRSVVGPILDPYCDHIQAVAPRGARNRRRATTASGRARQRAGRPGVGWCCRRRLRGGD